MSIDQTLGDTVPDQQAARPAPDPVSVAEAAVASRTQMSVADVLAAARLPEKRAKICTRADLQARYDELVATLGTLVNGLGEILEDAETALGEKSAVAKAKSTAAEIEAVRVEMGDSMWLPLFRGMSADDLEVFNKQHYPKKEGADLTDYHAHLIAATAIDPPMSVDDVKQLRGTLPVPSFLELVRTANDVCAKRIDIPKSLGFSVIPTEK